MDKVKFYKILDISEPSEFEYYENVASLFEEDEIIESNLIFDLLKEIDINVLIESCDNYFEEFLKSLPDEESQLYLTVDNIKMVLLGMMIEDANTDDLHRLADEIYKFRKWYAIDTLVYDKLFNKDISVRDARFNILASNMLGESYSYDFRRALEYDINGYDILL